VPAFVIPPRVVREWPTAQEDAMIARRLAGASVREVAQEQGLDVARVQQILKMRGMTPAEVRARRQREADKANRALGRRVSTLLRSRGPLSNEQVCDALGCTPAQLLEAVLPADRPMLRRKGSTGPRFSDDQVFRQLRSAATRRATRLDRPGPVTLPMSWWDAHRHEASTLSGEQVAHRFHDWETACRRAGLPVADLEAPAGRTDRWGDDDLAWWLAVYLERIRAGRITASPSRVDFDDWARSDPRVPGSAALVERFGDWQQAVGAAARQRLD
jgi:hypothetical protein